MADGADAKTTGLDALASAAAADARPPGQAGPPAPPPQPAASGSEALPAYLGKEPADSPPRAGAVASGPHRGRTLSQPAAPAPRARAASAPAAASETRAVPAARAVPALAVDSDELPIRGEVNDMWARLLLVRGDDGEDCAPDLTVADIERLPDELKGKLRAFMDVFGAEQPTAAAAKRNQKPDLLDWQDYKPSNLSSDADPLMAGIPRHKTAHAATRPDTRRSTEVMRSSALQVTVPSLCRSCCDAVHPGVRGDDRFGVRVQCDCTVHEPVRHRQPH